MLNAIYVIFSAVLVGCQIQDESTAAWTPNPLCPYPSEDTVFLPDPYDCSKYYECFEGNLFVMLCPENLVWNDEQKTCDYPEDTDCRTISNSSTSAAPATSPLASTTISPAPSTTSENDVPNTTWTPNPLCPYPSEEPVFLPDPYDCSKYYECFEGNLYVMRCPENLIWNDEQKTCDYPEDTNCTEIASSPPAEPATSPAPPAPPQGNLCANQADGSYVANPMDCHTFFECNAGREFEGTCPTGTAWNERILNCDFPENVDCS